jgi:hypothetical protein
LAALRRADRHYRCLFIKENRKWPAHGQGDANDSERTFVRFYISLSPYREEAKLIFERIEEASVMTSEVRSLCDEM